MTDETPEGEKIYPAEEQGIEKEETSEEEQLDMDTGKKDEEIYDEDGREKLMEDGEISPQEEAFMEGASGKGKAGHCAECDKPLSDEKEEVIERVIDGKTMTFCSDKCADKHLKEKEQE
jgi:hypothetical protein